MALRSASATLFVGCSRKSRLIAGGRRNLSPTCLSSDARLHGYIRVAYPRETCDYAVEDSEAPTTALIRVPTCADHSLLSHSHSSSRSNPARAAELDDPVSHVTAPAEFEFMARRHAAQFADDGVESVLWAGGKSTDPHRLVDSAP